MNKEELFEMAEEARFKRLETQPRGVDEMIVKIRDLHKRYPKGRVPLHEAPMVTNEVFLDICERIVALEQYLEYLSRRLAEKNQL